MTKTPSDLPATYIVKLTGIPRKTFNNRVISKQIRYIDPFRGTRLYSKKDWDSKNSDYPIPDQIDARQ